MRHIITFLTLLAAIPLFCGCGPSDRAADEAQPRPLTDLTPVQQEQQQIALAARDALFQQLLEKLAAAMGAAGPASAIEVCREQAPRVAADVSGQYGLRIGRTSHRLRNPKNTPPDWAKALVEAQVAEPRFVALPDDHLGVLLPIRLKAQCLMCHGAADQIPPDVQAALDRHYRRDQATGFKEGGLRGWFWVDVPRDAQLPAGSDVPDAVGEPDVS